MFKDIGKKLPSNGKWHTTLFRVTLMKELDKHTYQKGSQEVLDRFNFG